MKADSLDKPKEKFKYDDRETNPRLHLLHVKWAVKHLTVIDRVMYDLDSQSSITLNDMLIAMHTEREKLVRESAAFADADEIIKLQAEALRSERTFAPGGIKIE